MLTLALVHSVQSIGWFRSTNTRRMAATKAEPLSLEELLAKKKQAEEEENKVGFSIVSSFNSFVFSPSS